MPVPRRAASIAGLFALAWVLPLAVHAVRLDVLLPVVLVLAVASLLRVGATLLDRLVPAVALSLALVMALGLLVTVWPWGLAPVPMAGTLFTLLVVVGLATGRRPRLPRRVAGSDLLVVGSGLLGWAVAIWPTIGRGFLPYAMINDDRMRHFSLFDAIGQLGGYPFLRFGGAPLAGIERGTGNEYPPGMHFVFAFLDSCVRSGHGAGDALGELSRYHGYVTGVYGFFVLAVVWAVRWVLGPGVTGWRRALVLAAAGGFLATGVMTAMLVYASDAEMLALGLLAVGVALLARPAARVRETVVLVAAVVVALSFTYTLILVFVLPALVSALYVYRARLRADWRTVAASALVAGPLALVPIVVPTLHGFDGAQHALTGDPIITTPARTVLLLALLAVVALFGLRAPRLRVLAGTVALSLLGMALWYAYIRLHTHHDPSYYYQKAVRSLTVVLLLGAAPAVTVLRAGRFRRRAAASALAAVLGFALVGGFSFGPARFTYGSAARGTMLPGEDTSWGAAWASGRYFYSGDARTLTVLRGLGMVRDGRPTLVLYDKSSWMNTHLSLTLAILGRNVGTFDQTIYGLRGAENLVDVPRGPLPPEIQASWDKVELAITGSPVPLRVVANDPVVAERLTDLAARRPDLRLEVLFLPALPRTTRP